MILVIGGAGYIGSHFVRTLEKTYGKDLQVVVVDSLAEGHAESLSNAGNVAHFQKCNVGDIDVIEGLLRKYSIKAVVHFAASCYVEESQKNPAKYFDNNVV